MPEILMVLYRIFAFIGFLLLITLIAVGIFDFTRIKSDLDFNKLDLTTTGLVKRGYLLDTHLNCTNGYAGLSVFNLPIYYKPVAESTRTSLKLAKACKDRNFKPEFK